MSGGSLVWLTNSELVDLLRWNRAANFTHPDDDKLREKLEAIQEEVACRARPRTNRDPWGR